MSKEKDESRIDYLKKKINELAKLKEKDIDEYIEIIGKLLENNEIVIAALGRIKVDFGEVPKYNPKFEKTEEEAINIINDIIALAFIDSKDVSIYEDVMSHKKIQYIIEKLKESKLYEIICSRIYLERNSYLESEYQYISRTFPNEKKPLTIKSCEVNIAYNDHANGDIREIIIEFDELQLKKIISQLQEALEKFRE